MNNPLENLGVYELLQRIGGGGMGTVYRARDRRTGGIVAVKVIHEGLTADQANVERFRREAHVASLLTSPYTVRVLEFGFDNGRYFMACEFVDGLALSDILKGGAVEPAQALAIVAQVAMALDEAEARGVIHRDIKPSNILITRDQSVKVTDFGIARLTHGPDLTIPGTYLGTLVYSAPEQMRGEPDIRSDFYSLGVTLYQCLTGELPFQGDTPFQLAVAVEQKPPPLDNIRNLPDEVVELVDRCLKKDVAERYQRASELAGAIERAWRSLQAPASDTWVADATAVLVTTRIGPAAVPEAALPASGTAAGSSFSRSWAASAPWRSWSSWL